MSKGESNFIKDKNIFKINSLSHQENYRRKIIKSSSPTRVSLASFIIALGVTQFQNNLNNDCNAAQYIFHKNYIFSR